MRLCISPEMWKQDTPSRSPVYPPISATIDRKVYVYMLRRTLTFRLK